METKNLIISGFTGYNYNQLKPYLKSIDESVSNCDKVMVTGEASEETIDKLVEHGWHVHKVPKLNNIPIHVARFLYIYEFLRENHENYNWVVSTDVKDVIFQGDPFVWLDKHLNDKQKIVAGSESIRYKDESWGNENLLQAYGPFVHERFKDNVIYNVGTLGGTAEYIRDLVFQIFFNGINRPIPIVDQAVYNVLLQTQPYKGVTFFADQQDGWACQAGTTVDPSKIEGFRLNLTEAEPKWKDGVVYTSNDVPFVIVHQYDRVPEWKSHYMKKFEQEDESQFFVYKV